MNLLDEFDYDLFLLLVDVIMISHTFFVAFFVNNDKCKAIDFAMKTKIYDFDIIIILKFQQLETWNLCTTQVSRCKWGQKTYFQ